MEKLLYALAWKNGDLRKVKHIVAGILSSEDDAANKAIVFNQFGIYLSGKRNEPIIDQHVLRAFAIFKYRENPTEIERFRKMDVVTKGQGVTAKSLDDRVRLPLVMALSVCGNSLFSLVLVRVLFPDAHLLYG
jgi:hypothetical protein